MTTRRSFLMAASALALTSSLPLRMAWGQSGLPATGQLLFGYPPGAIGSVFGGGLTDVLTEVAGVRYALVNVEGRNTRLAAEQVRKATPDGATLLHAQSTAMCLLPCVYRNLGYDPIRDFTPLGVLGEFTFSLTVGPMVPRSVTNLAHFMEWVRHNPDARDIGFSIYGSQGHLAVLTLAREQEIPVEAVAYRGTSMMISDLAGGRLAAGFTAAGNGDAALWANGTLRSIGVTRASRLPYWPDIMTLQEQGVPSMDLSAWYGWYAPAATPAPLVQHWRDTIVAMQASQRYKVLQQRLLLTQPQVAATEIPALITQETMRFRSIVKQLQLRPQD